jgi:biopolymer transport protein ExbB
MIQVFQRVVQQASTGEIVDAGGLANGIWEALITTAAGLTVAIPAYLAYRTITSIVDGYAVEMAEVSNRALEYLVDEQERPRVLSLPEHSSESLDDDRKPK